MSLKCTIFFLLAHKCGHSTSPQDLSPADLRQPDTTRCGQRVLGYTRHSTRTSTSFSPAPLTALYVTPNYVDPYTPLDGLLELHLHRGDFIEHCPNLFPWDADLNALSILLSFPGP